MSHSIFDSFWFSILFAFSLFLSIGSGILYAVKYKKKKSWESSGIENAVVGIFGLIISFTFLQAGNAHRERYAHIHREANNIDLLYRYSKEMPDSFSLKTKMFLLSFLNNHLAYKQQASDENFLYDAAQISESYRSYLRGYKNQNFSSTTANQLNKISDCFDQVQSSFILNAYSYTERTPSFVILLLISISLLIGFLVGFMNAIKSNIHYLIPIIYFVMISLTMIVINDLNNPFSGFIKPNYHHLQIIRQLITTT